VIVELDHGWELAASAPGACSGPSETDDLDWSPAQVPGTAAAAVGADGRDFDADDWWFRVAFEAPSPGAGERLILALDGLATVAEVHLNGELILSSSSMWAGHRLDVTDRLQPNNELAIVCRALKPLLAGRRRPAARWRSRIVYSGNLRWYRTMMLGRSPDYARGPAPVGPWRPVRLERLEAIGVEELVVRPRLEGDDGVAAVRVRARGCEDPVAAVLGEHRAELRPAAGGWHEAELRIPDVERWWPHTHGEPALHELSIEIGGEPVARRRIGFRSLTWAEDIAADGLDLHVNGIPVFARGALWTPADLVSLAPSEAELRTLLELARGAGMNMLRIPGTGAYESPTFHDLCDELGILVWQDLMFATLDYPIQDPEFRAVVESEAREVLERLAGRPSLAVVCANHELEQQPAMLGLDPELGRDPLWEEELRRITVESGADCAYLPGTPYGGELPFRTNRGVAHFFAVGGYFGSIADVRRGEVRFAAECLPCASVPEEIAVPTSHPDWKLGVPRDPVGWGLGNGWDFDDVRDFYFERLFGTDPTELRRTDQVRYLELSRAVPGELMAEVIGEWRRSGSPCRGALVLWLKDVLPGAGFGVIDHAGTPKVPYHYLRRAFAPVAVWTTDEGLNGVVAHASNERDRPVSVRLRVGFYRDFEACVAEGAEDLELAPRSSVDRNVETLIGRFVDAAYAYHFGPPAHDAIVVSLESATDPGVLISQSVRFPLGPPLNREASARLGLDAVTEQRADGAVDLTIQTRRLVYGMRVRTPGFVPDDDAFSVEPGGRRAIRLTPAIAGSEFSGGSLTALNLDGQLKLKPTSG
jgi:beta-mannosidase